MVPAFLITFREVIEATFIVATILGILYKLNHTKSIKTAWYATGFATAASILLLALASIFGLKMQEIYSGTLERTIEGVLMITSSLFITWAVFFLHNFFGRQKLLLLQKMKNTIGTQEQKGIFILVFTAVFREGFEIVLFLSTIYFSSDPLRVFSGFGLGLLCGIIVSFAFFSATLKLPVYYTFKGTSVLLILFAAGLMARGVHEFAEAGFLPEIGEMIFAFIPKTGSVTGDMIKAIFGITKKMDMIQLSLYSTYVALMSWWVFFRENKIIKKTK
ncbi:MAG: Iron permease FTR1 [Candidatus Roizmanbacteria bacterium GW2011_GWA2_37_7]|uniref:Iron permease FTR1 n=1 Tax=Candidatus Roizmanbacteria bacterium GW2011_GWA2_37_7 TaxID=1618481 RepID=A0A0G0H7R7_9BACT|nr:MAG: Iron permease FTR1 [Candidatus Roizmanbacteria bacterium GW2011_GWA2_37_7]